MVVCRHAAPIAALQCDAGQVQRGVDRAIEFRAAAAVSAHQSAAVDNDHHVAMAFHLKAPHDKRLLPCRSPPINTAWVVAHSKRVERLEFGAATELPRPA